MCLLHHRLMCLLHYFTCQALPSYYHRKGTLQLIYFTLMVAFSHGNKRSKTFVSIKLVSR